MTKHHPHHCLHRHPSNGLSVRVAVAALAAGVGLGLLIIGTIVVLNPLP